MTTKQEAFVVEYLKDFNATQAAIRAGYSENTARSIGSENLSKPDIQEAIEKEVTTLLGDSRQDIIDNRKLWRAIMDDPEATNGEKMKASELLGKYRGMFIEKREVEHSGAVGVNVSSEGFGKL